MADYEQAEELAEQLVRAATDGACTAFLARAGTRPGPGLTVGRVPA
jgi:hypothetical protein